MSVDIWPVCYLIFGKRQILLYLSTILTAYVSVCYTCRVALLNWIKGYRLRIPWPHFNYIAVLFIYLSSLLFFIATFMWCVNVCHLSLHNFPFMVSLWITNQYLSPSPCFFFAAACWFALDDLQEQSNVFYFHACPQLEMW